MRRLLWVWAFLAFTISIPAAVAADKDVRVYDPRRPVLPEYVVKERSDGSLGVYEPEKPLLPKYIVRDGKVYDPREPVLPLKKITGDKP